MARGPVVVVRRRNAPGFPIEYISESVERFGFDAATLGGGTAPFSGLIHPDDRAGVEAALARLVAGEEATVEQDYRMVAADGAVRWVHDTTVARGDAQGRVTHLDGYLLDIAERHEARAALEESERRYHEIFQTNAVSMWVEDYSAVKAEIDRLRAEGVTDFRAYLEAHPEFVMEAATKIRVVDVNDITVEMFEADSKEELLGRLDQVFLPESLPCSREGHIAIAEGCRHFECETVNRTLHGRRFDVLMRVTVPADGDYSRLLVSLVDISARRRAEEEARRNSEELVSLLESTTDAYLCLDERFCITYFNAEAERLFGIRRQAVREAVLWDVLPELAGSFFIRFRKAMERQRADAFEGFYPPLGCWLETHLYPQDRGLWVFLRDVTRRREQEAALRASEERHRAVLDNAFDGIVTLDAAGIVLGFNRAAERIFGLSAERAIGTNFSLRVAEEARADLLARLRIHDPEAGVQVVTGCRPGGGRFPLEMALSALEQEGHALRVAVVRDISERRRQEQARREREVRMAGQHEALMALAHQQAQPVERLVMLRALTEQAAATLEVAGAAVWMLEEGGAALRCADLFLADDRSHRSGASLERTVAPHYFTALEQGRLLAADEASVDGRTGELVGRLPLPFTVGALLDAVVRLEGEAVAVISFLHREKPRHWHLDERNFAASVAEVVAHMLELCQRRRTEQNLLLAETAFDHSLEGILVTDPDGTILRVNQAFCRITGYGEEEVLGRNPNVLRSGRHGRAFYEEMWQALAERGTWQGEVWNRRKNGEIYPEWLTISTVRDGGGQVTHHIAIFNDISEKKAAEDRIHHLAYYDPLTDLPNRLMFHGHLQQAMGEARRQGRLVAVLYVDLDRFKTINDTLGHSVGDALIKEVARRLRQGVGASDIVARLGADEFAVMLCELHHAQQAAHIGQSLLEALGEPLQLAGQEVFVSASIGIALFPLDAQAREDLVKNAETAMFHAKEEGRNGYQFYRAEMNATAFERLVMENSLRRALERDEFVLHYQPQVEIASGTVVGVECLIRWRHPDLGLVSPGRFIPLLEETGMIVNVGTWVLRTACAQAVKWRQAGLPPLRMAVNLSPHQFGQRDLVNMITGILRESGLDPKWLELELTEGSLMRDVAQSASVLAELKTMGVHVSVDDFGTGYSSLSYLKRFPIDTLKIDQSFVHDVTEDPDDAAIAATIIAMGHSLKLKVVAEGVEECSQLALLRAEGCDQVQGFLYSRPLPADELAALLASSPRLARCDP